MICYLQEENFQASDSISIDDLSKLGEKYDNRLRTQ